MGSATIAVPRPGSRRRSPTPPTPYGSTSRSGARCSWSTRPTSTRPTNRSSPSARASRPSASNFSSRMAEEAAADCRVGKANGSRECAPDDRLRVPTNQFKRTMDRWARRKCAFAHPAASRQRAPADDRKAQLAGNPVDRGDRDQNHQDQERHLLPFEHADLLGQLQADAAGADDADDGGRARVRLDKIEHLARDDRQHLGYQAKAYLVQRTSAGGADAFDLL